MTGWAAAYQPWDTIECAPIPVPWARSLGVMVTHVELPGAVAAPSAEAVVEVAQVIAYVRVQHALAVQRFRQEMAQRQSNRGRIAQAQQARYEPPYVRMRCPVCGDTADAWVNDDGTLQDPRDVICGHKHDAEAMLPVEEE